MDVSSRPDLGFRHAPSNQQLLNSTFRIGGASKPKLQDASISVLPCPTHLPSLESLISTLENCRKEKNLPLAKGTHARIRERGLESHKTLGNYLVPLFVECGSVSDAQAVFDQLSSPNEHSWNSLIHGYVQCAQPQDALNLCPKMVLGGVCPSRYTFLALLRACAGLRSPRKSLEIHSEIVKLALEGDQYVGNMLVDVYFKCKSLEEAHDAFLRLHSQDVVSWSTLISGYSQCDRNEEALEFFEQMQQRGLCPNTFTFVSSLKACISIRAKDKGLDLHVSAVREGLDTNTFVGNTLIDFYAKWGSLAEAADVFEELQVKDTVSWNALISGYAENGQAKEAFECLKRMELEGFAPDDITYISFLKAFGSIQCLERGRQLHMDIVKRNLDFNAHVGSALVYMYATCNALEDGCNVFNMLPVRGLVVWNMLLAGYAKWAPIVDTQELFKKIPGHDVVSWNTLLAAYAEHGLLEDALSCLEHMQKEGLSTTAVSWNSVMSGYAENGHSETPFCLFLAMQEQGILPDHVTFMVVFKACGSDVALSRGKMLHAQCHKASRIEATTLIDMYGKCGSMRKAKEVFTTMRTKDVVGWTTLLAGYARHGHVELVFNLMRSMEVRGIRPDGVTALHVLLVCGHTGLLELGQEYFEDLCRIPRFSPILLHYNCIIDLFGRAGQLDVAAALLRKMQCVPELSTWNTILGACGKWDSMHLGSGDFTNAMQLDGRRAEPYSVMAKIYSHAVDV